MDDVGDVDRSSSQHSGHVKGDDGAEFDWFSQCKDVPPASSAEAIVFVYNYLVAAVVSGSVSVGGEGTFIRLPYVARPTANASLLQRCVMRSSCFAFTKQHAVDTKYTIILCVTTGIMSNYVHIID